MIRAHRSLSFVLVPVLTAFASACGNGRPDVVPVHEMVEPFVVYEMTFVTCPVQGVHIIDGMRFEFPPEEAEGSEADGEVGGDADAAADDIAVEELPGPAETTADWGFHLVVPPEWIEWTVEELALVEGPTNAAEAQEAGRRLRAPIVLGLELPEPLADFDHYGDGTELAFVHLFVRREPTEDGRHEVFVSKH